MTTKQISASDYKIFPFSLYKPTHHSSIIPAHTKGTGPLRCAFVAVCSNFVENKKERTNTFAPKS